MAVFVIGWVVVLFVFFVFLFALEGKITTEKNWNILVSITACRLEKVRIFRYSFCRRSEADMGSFIERGK